MDLNFNDLLQMPDPLVPLTEARADLRHAYSVITDLIRQNTILAKTEEDNRVEIDQLRAEVGVVPGLRAEILELKRRIENENTATVTENRRLQLENFRIQGANDRLERLRLLDPNERVRSSTSLHITALQNQKLGILERSNQTDPSSSQSSSARR
jgi:hypothetical protein